MTVLASAKLRELAEIAGGGGDVKAGILKTVGNVSGYEPFHNLILVAKYVRPEKTRGGIIRVDRSLAEDRFQGKVGLVLKTGPIAFKDDQVNKFGGFSVKAGDWVVYRISDGLEFFFVDPNGRDGTPGLLIEDIHIKARINDPEMVY